MHIMEHSTRMKMNELMLRGAVRRDLTTKMIKRSQTQKSMYLYDPIYMNFKSRQN